uniref:G-type lectin S-receptor-like serine/threonine-protein kinase SD3-1 n=1 Tax=Erigeron canadensis TaxID=72917 RepID=UPI001CB9096C|nr:G-type lectin S-receptor-like serine/threonine-protein kinase SD3-1 [Erigeron canadensis]
MLESFLIFMVFKIPTKNHKGKSFIIKTSSFSCICSLLALVILLGFADCVLCNKESIDSAPLGFEISGFDKNVKVKNLVSENGVFQFGFLEKDGGEFVVGIRYNLGPKSANLPVWTVGGGVRVSNNSTFRLSMDGRLTLVENHSNFIVWSSDTSNIGVEKVTLLNNGNLVLMGSESRVVWASFDRPTNTLLPGQTLHYPQNLRASSTKSVSSYYTFVIREPEGLALMWESNITYWTIPLSSSPAAIKEARFDPNGVLGLYDDMEKMVWSISSKDFGETSVSLRHLRMDQDGNLRIYSWNDAVRSWRVGWQAVEDQCNVFGSCGLYSVCGYNSTGPICDCLYSDSLDSGNVFPSPDSGASGCKKMVDLGNCKAHTSMSIMKQTVLYGLYPPHDIDMMLSEKECKEYCSNDTTCLALTSKNDGSGICTLKRTAFISGSTSPSIPSTSFLKVCLVPQAVAAKGANPNATPKAISFPFQVNYRKFISAVAYVVLVTVLAILVLELFIVVFVYHKRRYVSQNRALKGTKTNIQDNALIRLSYKEVQEITSGFSTQLGFFVFKGLLLEEMVVVAKVLDVTVLSEKEFIKAVSILGGTHHRNLTALKGFCFEAKHKILIYECIPNGSVDKWLFDDKKEKNWQQRIDIGVGVTRALVYLHTECQLCIPHGNLKLENVLLDDKLFPKVTDFGIKSFLQSGGSCSSSEESPSEKDIFMLGKMLIEIVLLSRNTVADSLDQVMDQVMQEQKYLDSEDLRGVERVVRIALWCMQNQPFLRPSVGEVMKVLEGTLSVDRPPTSFAYRNDHDTEINVAGVVAEIEPGSSGVVL